MTRLGKSLPIAAVMLATIGCHYTSDTPAVPTKPAVTSSELRSVPIIHPQRKTVVQTIELPGDLVGFYEAALHSKVTGYLVKMNVDKGDWVKTGQVLAVIEVPELQQNLERAEATLQINKLTWQRLDRVRKTDPRLVAQETVDIAYAKYMEAKAAAGALETMVSYTKIIAPFDGVITGRFADPGALIRAGGGDFGISGSGAAVSSGAMEGAGGHLTGGGPLLTEARLDPLRIYVYVPEREAAEVRIGMPASLTLRSFPGKTFHATVTRCASARSGGKRRGRRTPTPASVPRVACSRRITRRGQASTPSPIRSWAVVMSFLSSPTPELRSIPPAPPNGFRRRGRRRSR